jgi:Domain of unknown function (DUF4405)
MEMTRTKLNFVVDAVAFGAFLFLASTGVLLRYQLPPGSGGLSGRGTGRGEAQQTALTLWSWTRHDWGAIHFWIACALLAVLAVHLFLHWKWVVCVVRGKATDRSGWRLGLGAIGLVALVLLAAAPWLSPTTQQTRAELRQKAANRSAEVGSLDAELGRERFSDQIRGSMSLEQIAALAGSSVDYLVEQLGLPDNVSSDARVGQLLREQGLHMSDLRRVVDQAIGTNREAQQDREAVR